MLRLIIFAVVMLALSAICNGQGKTSFGDNSPTDTSFTLAQLKLNAYGGGADTMILIVLPNGAVKKVDKSAFSGGTSTLQQVLAAGDSSHGNVMKIALDSPSSGHVRLYGGVNTDMWLTNNTGKEFSLGVGGNGTGLEDRFYVYDVTNNLAPFVIDDDGHVHMGGFADVSPGLSVESNLGFSPVITANGMVRLRSTPVRSNFNDSTLGLRSGDTVTVMPPLQPVLDGKQAALGYDPLPSYAGGYLAYSDTGTVERENNVIIISGQSNALGQFPDTAMNYLPLEYYGAQSNIKMWWTGDYNSPVAGHFENMLVPDNTRDSIYTNPANLPLYYSTGWGIEQSSGRKLQQVLDDTLYVLKATAGGRNITYWESPSGSEWQRLEQYITESIDSLDAKGVPVNFRSFIWLQGESDALENIEALYEDRLRTFISNWRALDSRLDSTLFVMVKLRAGTVSQSKVNTINAAFDQMAAESPFNVTVDPVEIGATLFDGLHYGKYLLQIGNAVADTILAHTVTNPTLVNIGQGSISSINTVSSALLDFKVIPSLTNPTLSLFLASGNALLNSTSVSTGLGFSSGILTNRVSTGFAGGQTINGGTAVNDDLTIRSTSATPSASSYIHNIANNFTFGNVSFTPSMDIHFQKSVSATLGMMLENTNAGGAARAAVDWKNDAGHFGRISKLGSGWVSTGLNKSNDFVIGNAGAGDIVISNSVAAGVIDFGTNGTLRMKIKASGVVNISGISTYADNTAALAGGLVAGDVYRTSTGVLMIVF